MTAYLVLGVHTVNMRMLQQQLDYVNKVIIALQIVKHLIAGG